MLNRTVRACLGALLVTVCTTATSLRAQAVPLIPPDTLPANLTELEKLVRLDSGHTVSTTLLMTTFRPEATQGEREAAIRSVGGRVIGGRRIENGGVYYVLVPGDGTVETIQALADSLSGFPHVRFAFLYVLPLLDDN